MILRIIAIVAALAAGGLFFVSKGKLAEQKAAADKANQATAAVQAELSSANEKVQGLEGRLKTQLEAVTDAKQKLEGVRSEMYTARQEVSRSQQQLQEAKKSISQLESTTKRLRADLLRTEEGLAAASKEGEIAQLNERIAELEKLNTDLSESLEDAKQDVAKAMASAAAVSASAPSTGSIARGGAYSSGFKAPAPAGALPVATLGAETTIQSVSAENGLIVLANNADLGLTLGMEVTLIADREALGKVQFIELTETLAVANILPGADARSMSEGATVSLLQ